MRQKSEKTFNRRSIISWGILLAGVCLLVGVILGAWMGTEGAYAVALAAAITSILPALIGRAVRWWVIVIGVTVIPIIIGGFLGNAIGIALQ